MIRLSGVREPGWVIRISGRCLLDQNIDFLAGYALEEIQISTAETRISILPYQTLFVTGGWRHPALPNVPQTYPRTMIPVLRKLLTKPESEREGEWAQAIFVA